MTSFWLGKSICGKHVNMRTCDKTALNGGVNVVATRIQKIKNKIKIYFVGLFSDVSGGYVDQR